MALDIGKTENPPPQAGQLLPVAPPPGVQPGPEPLEPLDTNRGSIGVKNDEQAREQELRNARAVRIARLEDFWHAHTGTWLRVEEEIREVIEYPKWVPGPDGPRLVSNKEEEGAEENAEVKSEENAEVSGKAA